MKLNDLERKKFDRQNCRQKAKHAKLYSDIRPTPLKRQFVIPLGFQQRGPSFLRSWHRTAEVNGRENPTQLDQSLSSTRARCQLAPRRKFVWGVNVPVIALTRLIGTAGL